MVNLGKGEKMTPYRSFNFSLGLKFFKSWENSFKRKSSKAAKKFNSGGKKQKKKLGKCALRHSYSHAY